MKLGQKAARIGLDSEKDILNAINKNEIFRNHILEGLKELGFAQKGELSCFKKERRSKKDIIIKNNDELLGVSIKSSRKTSFHHLDRRWLDDWKSFLKMPKNIYTIIKSSILRKASQSRSKFIIESDRKLIKEFFQEKYEIIIKEIFMRDEEDLILLLINNKLSKEIHIYRMDECLDFIKENIKNNIGFTDKGGLIKLGDFIKIQRKGGNGKRIKIPKTDFILSLLR